MPGIKVCLSPILFPLITIKDKTIIVVIDILRATTSFCTAFDYHVNSIIPLDSLEEAIEFKRQGMLVAAERDGLKPEFADFSNSAFDFMNEEIAGKDIYYTTTNGTKAIKMGEEKGTVVIGSFLNLNVLTEWLIDQKMDVIAFCAGWKDNYSLEDTLCAGALVSNLADKGNFTIDDDAALSASILWRNNSSNPYALIEKSDHYKRLVNLGFQNVLSYSVNIGKSSSIPVLINGRLHDIKKLVDNKF